MNELQVFAYEGRNVRTVTIDNEPWWVLSDVCGALSLSSPHKVADRLDEDEKGLNSIPTLGGTQDMTVINESGLYSVILRSDKPEAKAFKRWITHEVLPAIRKTGIYNKTYPPKASSVSEIVQFGRFIRQLMKDQNATPYQIAEVVIEGIRKIGVDFPQQALLPLNSSNFDKVRDDELDMIEFSYTFPNSTYQDYLLYRSMIKNSR